MKENQVESDLWIVDCDNGVVEIGWKGREDEEEGRLVLRYDLIF